jgi:polyribonucleotide nucleotidyltransferase
MHILGIMKQAISEPNKEISQYAPGVMTLQVPFEKIGEVIGPSGKIIKGIIAKYGVDVDIEDATGKTYIYGKDRANVAKAADTIQKLIKEYQPGDVVTGKVFRIESYGAFIKIDDTDKEGMIHISQISDKRINNINDVIKMGQELRAKVSEINEKGQLSLTLK